ncbi:MAG: hypothetical protein PHX62_08265, partial [Bacilli bacterium]|nr:hypothetical protein [Bacilli bacterium]
MFDYKHFKEKGITITKGNKPNEYENQAYIYLNSELENVFHIGDSYEVDKHSFVIAGFFTSDIDRRQIIDLKYYHNQINKISRFSIVYNYDANRNFNQDVKRLNKMLDELKNSLDSGEDITTSSTELDILNLIKTVAKIIIAAIFFIATILILLSIGSVSNSIMISVDQNKKFIGLLKTLGLKDKDIKD